MTMSEATKEKYSKPPAARGVVTRFPRAILELAKLSQYGTTKHEVSIDDVSYRDIPDGEGVLLDAQVRHICQEAITGEVNEDDGGHLHATQDAWNALARLEIILIRRGQTKEPPEEEGVEVKWKQGEKTMDWDPKFGPSPKPGVIDWQAPLYEAEMKRVFGAPVPREDDVVSSPPGSPGP